ncbi:MAG TPA: DUF2795 domain-containing protein [Thermoleophilaceae bacterium]|nr:DUF2795 domain-containing protein [Thermoleophilaceae bacterium]
MSDSPVQELQKYVHGVHYPSRREIVVEAARRNGAPDSVIEKLNHLLPRVAGPHEVLIALRQPPHESAYLSQNRFRTGPGLGRTSNA